MSDIFVVLDPRGTWISPNLIGVNYLFRNNAEGPAALETNQHWIGRFTATRHTIRRDLLFYGAWDPPAAETNTHWLGRHTPTTHRLGRHLSFQDFQSTPPNEANPHWAGKYTARVHTVRRDLLWSWAWDPLPTETNVHWIGRFRQTTYALLASSRQNPATDIFVAPAAEANPHWFGTHIATSFNINLANIQGGDFNQVETNPNSIGRFTPTTHKILASLRQHRDFQTAVVAQAETNVHWIGRYTPTVYTISISLRQHPDFLPPTAETNPHFLGTFTPTRHIVNLSNIQGGDFAQVETNPNFIGRFTATKHNVARQLNHFYGAWDTAVVAVSETNTNWLGRFAPAAYKISISLRQHQDFQPPAAETNSYFFGKFTPNQIRILPGLRQTPAIDFVTAAPEAETNPNFLGKFTPNQIRILPGLRQNPATDFIVGPPVIPPTEGAGGERWPRYSWRWCDFTDREWFKAFCEEFYRLKSLKSPELRRQQAVDLERALDLAIERAVGGAGEPEWTFDIRAAGGMLQDEIGPGDAFDRLASGLARLALEIDDEEAFLLLGS